MTEEQKIKRREAKNNRYHNMSEEQKVKKREYERNRSSNMSEEQKNKKKRIRKKQISYNDKGALIFCRYFMCI